MSLGAESVVRPSPLSSSGLPCCPGRVQSRRALSRASCGLLLLSPPLPSSRAEAFLRCRAAAPRLAHARGLSQEDPCVGHSRWTWLCRSTVPSNLGRSLTLRGDLFWGVSVAFSDRVLSCSPDWPGTPDPSASASQATATVGVFYQPRLSWDPFHCCLQSPHVSCSSPPWAPAVETTGICTLPQSKLEMLSA